MTRKKPDASRGRPPVPIERHPQRFEIACIWAFLGFGVRPFDAARRALLIVRGGPITMADIEGTLRLSQASIPLPDVEDEPDAAVRRLFTAPFRPSTRFRRCRAGARSRPWA